MNAYSFLLNSTLSKQFWIENNFRYDIINVETLIGARSTDNVCSFVKMNSRRSTQSVLTSAVIHNESVENTVKGKSLVILCPLCSFPCAYLCAPDPSGVSSTGPS